MMLRDITVRLHFVYWCTLYVHVSCKSFKPGFVKWASRLCYRVCSNEQIFIGMQHVMPGHPSGLHVIIKRLLICTIMYIKIVSFSEKFILPKKVTSLRVLFQTKNNQFKLPPSNFPCNFFVLIWESVHH